eukprot:maker-scaffold146_size311726-snap-gene-0.14 protein:Tk07043 transcript:maker-scaffold146_size311726-snap-gene-0.14-mRNA-1 annotation:"wsc domain-containing protein 2"
MKHGVNFNRGTIQNGVKTGLEISIMHLAEASGFVLGRVDARGHLTGDNICLIIVQKSAGKWVSVCGRFRDGAIIQGRPTDYQDIRLVPNSDGTDWDLEIDNTTSEGSEDHELIFDFDPLMFGTRRDMMVAQMTWIYLQFIERPNSIFPFPTQEKDYQAVVLRVPYPHLRQTLTLEEYCPLLINSRLLPQSPTLWSISLASYPGAGSRWLMGHLSAETYLESVYFDSVANNTEQKSIFLTVKNHHQSPQSYHAPLTGQRREHEDIEWRMNDIMRFRGKSLVLIRNPYLAIVSYWNHAQVDEVDMNPNLNLAEDLRSTKFEAFFMNEIGLWFEVAADWIVIGSEVHVVHYEDMKNDLRSEMLRITRDFLNIHVHPTRQACFGLTQYQKFKRSTKLKLTQAMFTPEMIEKAESYMKRLDHLLRSDQNITPPFHGGGGQPQRRVAGRGGKGHEGGKEHRATAEVARATAEVARAMKGYGRDGKGHGRGGKGHEGGKDHRWAEQAQRPWGWATGDKQAQRS